MLNQEFNQLNYSAGKKLFMSNLFSIYARIRKDVQDKGLISDFLLLEVSFLKYSTNLTDHQIESQYNHHICRRTYCGVRNILTSINMYKGNGSLPAMLGSAFFATLREVDHGLMLEEDLLQPLKMLYNNMNKL